MTADDTLNAILRRIIMEPDVDLHRLVYADRLDESGTRPEHAARAKFIRGAVEHAGRGFECYENPGLYDVGFRSIPDGLEGWQTTFDRGFVSALVCDAATFLKHADALIWHETQRITCPICGGHVSAGSDADNCRECDADSTIPRPCPPTAQPIRTVRLTTQPDERDFGTISGGDFANYKVRYYRFPGVEFDVRNASTDIQHEFDDYPADPPTDAPDATPVATLPPATLPVDGWQVTIENEREWNGYEYEQGRARVTLRQTFPLHYMPSPRLGETFGPVRGTVDGAPVTIPRAVVLRTTQELGSNVGLAAHLLVVTVEAVAMG